MRNFLKGKLPCLDSLTEDPQTLVARQYTTPSGTTYHFYQVNLATPKWKWENVSAPQLGLLTMFFDHLDLAVGAGGFTAPADMNPVTRSAQEHAYYKNRAMATLADYWSTQLAGNSVTAQHLVGNRYIAPLDVW